MFLPSILTKFLNMIIFESIVIQTKTLFPKSLPLHIIFVDENQIICFETSWNNYNVKLWRLDIANNCGFCKTVQTVMGCFHIYCSSYNSSWILLSIKIHKQINNRNYVVKFHKILLYFFCSFCLYFIRK